MNTRTDLAPPESLFVPHAYKEQQVDLGEVRLNYVMAGSSDRPALLLIPGQTESWWGYEAAIKLLESRFNIFAVDLRGQGRSTRTPGRYTFDNMGNDLVRFIATVIGRPVIASGCSSGGVLSAWLSAFSLPGQIRGAHYEDPPLFACELTPAFGHSIRQQVVGPLFALFSDFLGDQWKVGDWSGLRKAAAAAGRPLPETPGQQLKEYDPEWARAFVEGRMSLSCPHDRMLSRVKVPVLFTHHARVVQEKTGMLIGAISDFQAERVVDLVKSAGQEITYMSLPDAAHALHAADPQRFAKVLIDWAETLPS